MAKETRVVLIDDIDGGEAAETVRFGLDGTAFEIDLSLAHEKELRGIFAPFVGAATQTGKWALNGRSATRLKTDRERNDAIRAWAADQGEDVSGRGRIPQRIIDAYDAAR